jgi:hypothetical protein
MSDLSPKAQAIVDAARADDVSPSASKSRIKRRVLARVATAAAIGTAAATTSKTATSLAAGGAAGTASLASGGAASTAVAFGGAKLVVGVALSALVAGGVATTAVVSHRHSTSSAALQIARPPRDGTSPAPPERGRNDADRTSPALPERGRNDALKAIAPAAPSHVQAPIHGIASAVTPERRTETLEEELPLLQGAQRALRAGDSEQALILLESHARRFPDGALAEERRAVYAVALCRARPGAAAQAEANGFLRETASSPLAERVREACIPQVPEMDGVERTGGSH